MFNATNKVGTLLGVRPYEGLLLTEKKSLGVKNSSGSTSVAKHHRYDAAVKVVARPEISEFLGPGADKISPGHLKNPLLWYHLNTKGGTIPGGMHGTVGPSEEALPCPELVEFSDPAILGTFNATEKVGTLLGGRPDEDSTCP